MQGCFCSVNAAEQMVAVKFVDEVLVLSRREARLFEFFVCRRREGTCPNADGDQPIETSLAQ
jgi:hypothetical protein